MTTEPNPVPTAPQSLPTRARVGWQVGVRALLLVVAFAAVAIAIIKERGQIAHLNERIGKLRPLARDLVIDDLSQVAVVKRHELWIDDNQWDVYLPPGAAFRLAVATRGVGQKGLAPPVRAVPLQPGRHLIGFEQTRDEASNFHLTIKDDGKPVIRVVEPADWTADTGTTSNVDLKLSHQFAADQPVELLRQRFTITDKDGMSTVPADPAAGVLIWIER